MLLLLLYFLINSDSPERTQRNQGTTTREMETCSEYPQAQPWSGTAAFFISFLLHPLSPSPIHNCIRLSCPPLFTSLWSAAGAERGKGRRTQPRKVFIPRAFPFLLPNFPLLSLSLSSSFSSRLSLLEKAETEEGGEGRRGSGCKWLRERRGGFDNGTRPEEGENIVLLGIGRMSGGLFR